MSVTRTFYEVETNSKEEAEKILEQRLLDEKEDAPNQCYDSGAEATEMEWWHMKTVLITVEVYDNSTTEDVERAISTGLDNNGIDCTYDVEEKTD